MPKNHKKSSKNGAVRQAPRERDTTRRKRKTRETSKVEEVLREHFPDFPPSYPPEAYRYNSASIRVRIVSPRFRRMTPMERIELVTPILNANLPEETCWDIMYILAFTPDEVKTAPANTVFEKVDEFRR